MKTFVLVDTAEFPDVPAEYLQNATVNDLYALVTPLLRKKIEGGLLKVLFWNYDESKLLPPRVGLDQFCANPATCLPLESMFRLYGISDIKAEIANAKAAGTNALANLLRRVADKTTKHFHETWSEYDGITFSLTTDGPELVAAIQDASKQYELSQRSDGFKRFVTFLLMVSVEEATNRLRNTLILIDEPEIGLHPTGARYLLKELIGISENNYVVFSTHSIFMIDDEIINRHLIVRKADEITVADEVTESNIRDEEVIYKSLGYSIFSNLKPKNLIFEGWRDKKLFETAISRVPAAHEPVRGLREIGRCFTQGVKQIKNVTPLFEAGQRKCLILSDNDAPAREQQRDYEEAHGYGIWKRYDEILPGTPFVTGEDFIKEAAFNGAIEEISTRLGIPQLSVDDLNRAGGKIHALRQWLSSNEIDQAASKQIISDLKDSIFENLKNSEVKAEYYEYLAGILPIVNGL